MLRFSGAGVSDVGSGARAQRGLGVRRRRTSRWWPTVSGERRQARSPRRPRRTSCPPLRSARFGDDPEHVIRDAVAAARVNSAAASQRRPGRDGMATTLTVLVSDGERVAARPRRRLPRLPATATGGWPDLARPHLRPDLVDAGRLEPRGDRRATRGATSCSARSTATPEAELDATSTSLEVDVRPGDRLLLCSDGLTDMVADERIAEVLRLQGPALGGRGAHPGRAGGRRPRQRHLSSSLDVVDGPLVVGDGRLLGAVCDLANIVDPGRPCAIASD